jgi:hypothetical protein
MQLKTILDRIEKIQAFYVLKDPITIKPLLFLYLFFWSCWGSISMVFFAAGCSPGRGQQVQVEPSKEITKRTTRKARGNEKKARPRLQFFLSDEDSDFFSDEDSESNESETSSVWIIGLDGQQTKQIVNQTELLEGLTKAPARITTIQRSPDNQNLVFTFNTDESSGIALYELKKRRSKKIASRASNGCYVFWTRKGSQLVFHGDDEKDYLYTPSTAKTLSIK